MKNLNRKTFKWVALSVAVMLTVMGLLGAGIYKFIEAETYKGMSDQQRADFDRFLTQEIKFPPEAFESAAFSEETLQLASEVLAQYEKDVKVLGTLSGLGRNPEKQDPLQVRNLLEQTKTFRENFSRLVRQPDYTVDVWQAAHEDNQGGKVFSALNAARYSLDLEAQQALLQGNNAAAMESADFIVRSSKARSHPDLLTRMINHAIFSAGLDVWEAILKQMTNEQRRAQAHKILVGYKAYAPNLPSVNEMLALDHLGTIRKFGKIDRSPRTGWQYMNEAYLAQQKALNLPQTGADVLDRMSGSSMELNLIRKKNAAVLYNLASKNAQDLGKRSLSLEQKYQALVEASSQK